MKNTHKLIALFLIFSLFIAESCKRKNEPTTINNAFEIFNNQTLVLDSTTSNHLKFVKQQDSVLILKKDSILYAFDIEKINAVFSNDVYGFYDINKEGFSELKLKKFNESEELKTKKEYLSNKKNAIENTIVFIEQDFNCADKYQLDEGSFDLTNTIQKNYIKYNVADFKFKPINEDVALFVEDNCKNISIKVLAILTIDSTKGNIIFKPIKLLLIDKTINKQIEGNGIFQEVFNSKNYNIDLDKSKANKTIKTKELSMSVPIKFKKINDRIEYENSMLILNYGYDSPMFIIQVVKESAPGYNSEGFSNLEKYVFDEIKNNLIPNAILHSKKVSKIDNKKSLCLNFEHYNSQLNEDIISDYNIVYHNGYLYKISFNYLSTNVGDSKSLIQKIKKSIKFKSIEKIISKTNLPEKNTSSQEEKSEKALKLLSKWNTNSTDQELQFDGPIPLAGLGIDAKETYDAQGINLDRRNTLGGVEALNSNTPLSEDKKALLEDLKFLDEADARLGTTSQRTHAVGDLDLENINIVKQDVNSTSNQQQNWWEKINDEDLIWFLIILVGVIILFFFIINRFLKENKKVVLNNEARVVEANKGLNMRTKANIRTDGYYVSRYEGPSFYGADVTLTMILIFNNKGYAYYDDMEGHPDFPNDKMKEVLTSFIDESEINSDIGKSKLNENGFIDIIFFDTDDMFNEDISNPMTYKRFQGTVITNGLILDYQQKNYNESIQDFLETIIFKDAKFEFIKVNFN